MWQKSIVYTVCGRHFEKDDFLISANLAQKLTKMGSTSNSWHIQESAIVLCSNNRLEGDNVVDWQFLVWGNIYSVPEKVENQYSRLENLNKSSDLSPDTSYIEKEGYS